MVKKNVPYKVLKALWIAEMIFAVVDIVALWVAWCHYTNGTYAFAITVGVFTLLTLIGMTISSFLNQRFDVRKHGWGYGFLAVLHLVFVIITLSLTHKGTNDNAAPALFTVLLVAILLVGAYLGLRGQNPFRKKA